VNLNDKLQELQTLDPNNPGAWPLWVRVGAVVILAVGMLIGGYKLLIEPELDDLSKQQSEETALFNDFQTRQKKVAALDAYRDQLKEMEKLFGNMLRLLPSRAEVANLLNDISQSRVAASLEEEYFRPLGDIPRDFYAEMPNQIVVVGSYHNLGAFVSGVAALPRIVTVDDVDVRPAGGGTLRMNAIAKTYRYLDDDMGMPSSSGLKAPPK
jgi:type IV pilus assembly protein PilO